MQERSNVVERGMGLGNGQVDLLAHGVGQEGQDRLPFTSPLDVLGREVCGQ